jgi:hypothetical protein
VPGISNGSLIGSLGSCAEIHSEDRPQHLGVVEDCPEAVFKGAPEVRLSSCLEFVVIPRSFMKVPLVSSHFSLPGLWAPISLEIFKAQSSFSLAPGSFSEIPETDADTALEPS